MEDGHRGVNGTSATRHVVMAISVDGGYATVHRPADETVVYVKGLLVRRVPVLYNVAQDCLNPITTKVKPYQHLLYLAS